MRELIDLRLKEEQKAYTMFQLLQKLTVLQLMKF